MYTMTSQNSTVLTSLPPTGGGIMTVSIARLRNGVRRQMTPGKMG